MLPKGLLKEYWRAISMLIRAMDMFTVFVAGWFAYLVRFNEITIPPSYLSAIAIGVLFTPMVFSSFNIYASVRGEGFIRHIMTLVQAVCVMGLMLAGLSFFTKSGATFSRTWFICWIGLTLL